MAGYYRDMAKLIDRIHNHKKEDKTIEELDAELQDYCGQLEISGYNNAWIDIEKSNDRRLVFYFTETTAGYYYLAYKGVATVSMAREIDLKLHLRQGSRRVFKDYYIATHRSVAHWLVGRCLI